jgi:hypothetical protein
MTKQKAAPRLTRKHLARAKRERLTSRILIVSVSAVLVIAVLVVAYGIYEQQVLLPRRPAAVVNGDEISATELEADGPGPGRSPAAAAFGRAAAGVLRRQPEVQQSVQQQIAQLDAQLADTNYMAAQTLQGLIQARLIRASRAARIIVGESRYPAGVEEASASSPTARRRPPPPTQDAAWRRRRPPRRPWPHFAPAARRPAGLPRRHKRRPRTKRHGSADGDGLRQMPSRRSTNSI